MDTIRFSGGSDPTPGSTSTLGTTLAATRLNVTATLEPDADADGYGDETQDGCPTSAAASGACPAPSPAGPGADKTAPVVSASAAKRDSIADGAVTVFVRTSEDSIVLARGTVTVPKSAKLNKLRRASAGTKANVRTALRLELSRTVKRALRRALRHRKIRARLTVSARDAAGNTGTVRLRVRLRR